MNEALIDELSADFINVDEVSMVDMHLAYEFFYKVKAGARVLLVGDVHQLPSVGAGDVFRQLILCGKIPVTVLNLVYRQGKDSNIPINAQLINEGKTNLQWGDDFQMVECSGADAAAQIVKHIYLKEIQMYGMEQVQIKQCVLLVHSISGVYGLNFVQNYPEKVKGFIAVDNTVYDEELAEAMEMEKKYMLQGIDEFQKIKNSFSSLEEFQMALKTDPDKYGAALPQVSGYTYTESDREEYIQAYSLSSNDTIRNEVNGMDQSLLSIKNKKFPSALPVLTMISSENVQNVPAWETAHRNQLDLESGNHQLYIVNGGHYIWYTNLTQVVQLIDEWRIENHF